MAELRYVDWDGLVYYDGKIKDFIKSRDESYLKMGGIVSFKNLPDPSRDNLNYIYKITDKFTANDRFEHPGYIYSAGTWVQCVNSEEDERWLYIIFNEETIGATADSDLSNYYTKSEVDKRIEEAISNIDAPELARKDYVDELFEQAVTEAEISELNSTVAKVEEDLEELSEQVKNLDFATSDELKAAIDSTETYVDEKIAEINIPEAELYVVDYNAPDYAAAKTAYEAGKVLVLTNAAPDVNSYAIMNYVSDKYITFTKFLISRSEAYGAFNTYYLRSDNTWEVSDEVILNKVEANVGDEATAELRKIRIGKNVYYLPDTSTFVTTEQFTTVEEKVENIQNTYITEEHLEQKNYVTEQYVTNNYVTQEVANNTYVTNDKVTEVVETQVNEVVTKEIETKVETVIQEKVDAGQITVNADAITYDTW